MEREVVWDQPLARKVLIVYACTCILYLVVVVNILRVRKLPIRIIV